jgi:hypothetical protein
VFSEASQRGATRIQSILDIYNRGSGQLVNREKSAVFFSKNCLEETKIVVRHELHIETEALADKYLGLPTAVGRSTAESFEFMPTRIKGIIGTWSGRAASSAGREVLLKSVAQAVPTYSMSCFLLSKITCKKMRAAMSNFWWGGVQRTTDTYTGSAGIVSHSINQKEEWVFATYMCSIKLCLVSRAGD